MLHIDRSEDTLTIYSRLAKAVKESGNWNIYEWIKKGHFKDVTTLMRKTLKERIRRIHCWIDNGADKQRLRNMYEPRLVRISDDKRLHTKYNMVNTAPPSGVSRNCTSGIPLT